MYSFRLKTVQTRKCFSNGDFYILRNSTLEKRQEQIKTLCNEELNIVILPKYPRCFEGSAQVPGRAAHTCMHTALPQRPLDVYISFIYSTEELGTEIKFTPIHREITCITAHHSLICVHHKNLYKLF